VDDVVATRGVGADARDVDQPAGTAKWVARQSSQSSVK
jgi:hypothetical protein